MPSTVPRTYGKPKEKGLSLATKVTATLLAVGAGFGWAVAHFGLLGF
jgi:hypothetical protein